MQEEILSNLWDTHIGVAISESRKKILKKIPLSVVTPNFIYLGTLKNFQPLHYEKID